MQFLSFVKNYIYDLLYKSLRCSSTGVRDFKVSQHVNMLYFSLKAKKRKN